jgi:hypothetical protein
MNRSSSLRFLMVALFSGCTWAQGVQNHDIFVSAGPMWNASQAIGATNVTVASSTGSNLEEDFGYQVARVSAVSLLLDVSYMNAAPGGLKANVPVSNSGGTSWSAGALGLRLVIPVSARLSFYTLTSGGGGGFGYPVVVGGSTPSVSTNGTAHGVFVFGGGMDVRLSKRWSIRMDVRDLVTGKDLSGPGRNHVLPSIGVGLHF